MEYYSHPHKLLKDHLYNVGNNIKSKIIKTNLSANLNKNVLKDIGYIIGISHDFGKYTTFFQEHLKDNNSSNLSNHSLLSAIFTYYNLKNYLSKNDLLENKLFKYLPLISYQIVKHHHGNLQSLDDDVEIKDYKTLQKQIKDIQENSISDFHEIYSDVQFENFYSLFDNIKDDDYNIEIERELAEQEYEYNFIENDEDLKNYYFIINQYLYSLLISYDKIDASKVDVKDDALNIEFDIINNYKEKKFNITKKYIDTVKEKPINDLSLIEMRERIYQEVLNKLETIDLDKNKIFTINAPTGSGKTITSLAVAMKIKEKIKDLQNARIIYSLPFTSIIEQNYEVIKDILSSIPEFKNKENLYLLKHHYFSDSTYRTGDENLPVEKALLHIENWDSTVIVTTFIQLFYTLIGYKNRMLKKFYNISNSIIILDEVQNIPIKYWQIVNFILKLLVKYFNTYIILLTATKPLIFSEVEAIELLENSGAYFNNLNRVRLKYDSKITTLDDLFDKLLKDKSDKKMVILNTIKSTIEIFEKIKEDERFSEYSKIYLSTNITPYERKKRIDKIKDIEKAIIVTTQLIEAGVDIDVDVIYRDMAPMDSIIQSCGRCNRNGYKNKIGNVVVMELKNSMDEGKNYWKYIYDRILVEDCTKNNLPTTNKNEDKFLQMINEFFTNAKDKMSMQASSELIKHINKFDYTGISQFKLIQELPIYVSVFIELDEAKKVWKKFKDEVLSLYENKEGDWHIKARRNFLKIKGEFYQYIINIPENIVSAICKKPTQWKELYILPNEFINDNKNKVYDSEELSGMGFNRGVTEWII